MTGFAIRTSFAVHISNSVNAADELHIDWVTSWGLAKATAKTLEKRIKPDDIKKG